MTSVSPPACLLALLPAGTEACLCPGGTHWWGCLVASAGQDGVRRTIPSGPDEALREQAETPVHSPWGRSISQRCAVCHLAAGMVP